MIATVVLSPDGGPSIFLTTNPFSSKNLFDFNAMHTHPDAVLSGCIYLKVDSPEQGVIQFLDAREGSPTAHWRCYTKLNDSTPLTEQAVTVSPREGDILFFPGWLRHWVTPNLTDQERVSVAFNIRMN